MTNAGGPTTAILLATYNGGAFLDSQLASLAGQTLPRVDVFTSDDGSTDGTADILLHWQRQWEKGRFEIAAGPKRGFAENFRSLAQQLTQPYDFVAFSDQDDVWDRDKLEAAIKVLSQADAAQSAVYFSRTRLANESGNVFGQSPLFARPPGFRNAIVQSIGGGNTMVLNRPGSDLFVESCRRTAFLAHDWWSYMLIAGSGGQVFYDPEPHISYRQHDGNVVGNNVGFGARIRRLNMLMGGRFSAWTEQNLQSLAACRDLLSDDARSVVDEMQAIHLMRSPTAMLRLYRSGIYRQTLAGNISLGLAAMLGKL